MKGLENFVLVLWNSSGFFVESFGLVWFLVVGNRRRRTCCVEEAELKVAGI